MLRSESELRRLVTRLERDYRQQAGFFSRHALPEYEAVRSLESEGLVEIQHSERTGPSE